MKNKSAAAYVFVMIVVLFGSLLSFQAAASGEVPSHSSDDETGSWIIKWDGTPDPEFLEASEVIRVFEDMNVLLAKPKPGLDEGEWRHLCDGWPGIVYMQKNKQVQLLSAVPNDPYVERQSYLKQIGAFEGWAVASQNDQLIIAMIDTGVDLNHPELVDNLIPGINLLQPLLPPDDDNGHGTNVAGVIAAAGNNGAGIAGLLWKAQLMPIKALDRNGNGNEARLGEGIRYAVDKGAKIIVLSVGLVVDAPFLAEVVQYAEEHGVLLVAAAGNDEGEMVRYPAAYPTVLAVGGIGMNNYLEPRSNFGPEIDVVAPWSVYTTATGGRYEYKDGTSMAAPQVAAVAALIWSRQPALAPHEVRNYIRQTAQDVHTAGWDIYTGYGLLRMDRALREPYRHDMYESNNEIRTAVPAPIGSEITASLQGGVDQDWYYVDTAYAGRISLSIIPGNRSSGLPPLDLVYFPSVNAAGTPLSLQLPAPVEQEVAPGRHYFRLSMQDAHSLANHAYRLMVKFHIYSDDFEDNDQQFKAYVLPLRNQTVVGTFHKDHDDDWYQLNIEESGTLKVQVTVNSDRMDPVLFVQKRGEKGVVFDFEGAGKAESTPLLNVLPGVYYILLSNDPPSAVIGEYELEIQYTPKYIDSNEPNDRSFQATTVSPGVAYTGVFDRDHDVDWFRFAVEENSGVSIVLDGIPDERLVEVALLDNFATALKTGNNGSGSGHSVALDDVLAPGYYYLRLTTDRRFDHQMYSLEVQIDPIVSGYRDIASHWAREAIVALTSKGVVTGYGQLLFAPERAITRAEAATMLVRALQPQISGGIRNVFSDVGADHWAMPYVSIAVSAGIIQGYPDGTFAPEQLLTRAEMGAMLARAWGAGGAGSPALAPYPDVAASHWSAASLYALQQEGVLTGYPDGTYAPDKQSVRGEFASLLHKLTTR